MAYEILFIIFYKGVKILNEIGSELRATRESSGISVSEVSADLGIKDVIIENIEDGKIGAFKDIYELKDYIEQYAKYLGLNDDKLINKFNEYLFEYTSKIPIKEIEDAVLEQTKELKIEEKVISPYTKKEVKHNKGFYVVLFGVLFLILLAIIIWSVKQITIDTNSATSISYVK